MSLDDRSNAYGRGYRAFRSGRAIYANPFDSYTSHDAQEWWKGWRAGKEEAEAGTGSRVPADQIVDAPIVTKKGAGQISAASGTFNPAINVEANPPRTRHRYVPPNYERMRERLRERFAPEIG